MIEDQHQVPISMYPMDMKCHQHLITTNSTLGSGRMLTDVLIQPSAITETLIQVSGLNNNTNNISSNNNNNNNSNIQNNLNSSSNNINCGINCNKNNNNNNNSNNNSSNNHKCSAFCLNGDNDSGSSGGGGGGGCNSINGNCDNHHSIITRNVQCGYCCQPICDRYIMKVVDTSYHENCLKCSTCLRHLVHSCFSRDGKLYCRLDYERLFIRNRCLGCGDKISSDELVMRTLENVFHLKCFACVVCGVQLKKGEQYVVKQGQLFCRFDYEKEVEMLQGYDFYGDESYPPKLDGRRGPKRPRTILNTQQRRAFKASFEISPKPCRKVRENLAKDTGLSLRIVQVWFQNQRAKVKKIQKKAKQDPNKATSETDSQESDSSLAKIKDENLSDSESLESHFSCTDKTRLIKEEIQNENIPFNCSSDKENCNNINEPILNQILGLSYSTFQQIMSTPFGQSNQMLNPIDRLYSMQNSYFRPEEFGYAETGKDLNEN